VFGLTVSGAVFSGSPVPSATLDGISYRVQGSTDVTGFGQPGAPVVTPLGVWTGQTPPAGYQFQRFRLEGSDGLPGRGFLRAVVTSP